MKKFVFLAVGLLVLAWAAKIRLGPADAPLPSPQMAPSTTDAPPRRKTASRNETSAPSPSPVDVVRDDDRPKAMALPTPTTASSEAPKKILPVSFDEAIQPNHQIYDAMYGVSATYPEGWAVRQTLRWGPDNRENSIFFSLPDHPLARSLMYYQKYTDRVPDLNDSEAYFRWTAESREAGRVRNLTDYKNESLAFRQINGRPTMSYFATYTKGDAVMAEYVVRILGRSGYVMFSINGPATDVQAIIPQVATMGDTVVVP